MTAAIVIVFGLVYLGMISVDRRWRRELLNGVIARKPVEQKGIPPDHDTL